MIHWLAELDMQKTVEVLQKVHQLYLSNENSFAQTNTLEEFGELYSELPQFEELDNEFYEIMDSDAEKIKTFVEDNLEYFISVTE